MELMLKIPEYLIAPDRSQADWQDFAAASLHTLLLESGTAIPPEVTADLVRGSLQEGSLRDGTGVICCRLRELPAGGNRPLDQRLLEISKKAGELKWSITHRLSCAV